jgi:hypothetical protein
MEQLRSLTSLRVSGHWNGMKQQLEALLALPLPLQLLRLQLFEEPDAPLCWLPRIAHLTQLTKLITHSLPPGAALPPSLRHLHVMQGTDLAPVLLLQQLQHLTIMTLDWPNGDEPQSGAVEQT